MRQKTYPKRRASASARRHRGDQWDGPPVMQSVYSGRSLQGFLLSRGRLGTEAFDANEKSLGVFSTAQAAANALARWRQ